MVGFNFDVPDELHKEFKKSCVDREIDMSERLIQLIEKDVKKVYPNWMKPKVNESG